VKDHLQEVRDQLKDILITDFSFAADVAEHVVQMKGKLFRPTLLFLSGQVGDDGKKNHSLLPMALVVELIHTATLIHDDTIDRATLRRGLQTLNSRWNDQVSIIMGDYLYSRSLQEMVKIGDHEVLAVISDASRRVALGEMREIQLSASHGITEKEYFDMIADKTASLISASCEVGAILGSKEYRRELRDYGEDLGMVFQITDDIADYQGRVQLMGKPVGTDLRERKVTLPLIEALRKMSASRKKEFETIFYKDNIEDEDVATVYEMIQEADGFGYARGWAVEYGERAQKHLKVLPDSPFKDALHACISFIVER
jgi:octaprenyl-diphosphate synthase